jgi:GAF domain-containing protein
MAWGLEEAVSDVLARTDDVELAMAALLRELGRLMGWRVGLFWERVGDGLVLRSTWHEGAGGHAFLERSAMMVFARGIGLPGRAWHEGRPLWVEDFRAVSSFPRAPEADEDDLRAAIALPVTDADHDVLGVLEFLGAEAERPPPETMATMALLGQRIGQFVRRAAP